VSLTGVAVTHADVFCYKSCSK